MKKNEGSVRIRKFSPFAFTLHCMIGIIICLIFSLVFSVLMLTEKLSESSIGIISCVSVFAGTCAASVLSARKFGKTLITSLAQGLVYFIVLYLLGAILFSRLVPAEMSPMIPLSCFSGALFGAVLTALFKRRKH